MQQVLDVGALNQPQMCSAGSWTHVDGLVRENSTGKCTSILSFTIWLLWVPNAGEAKRELDTIHN